MTIRSIEGEEDLAFLLEQVLLKRFSILVDGEPSASANALERAVDLHATTVIGSAGYQKCVNYLWRGWLMQDDEDPARFVPYKDQTNTSYWAHVDPDRMRVPRYQNAVQIIISLVFLGLYTGAINTINPTGDLDIVEGLLYLFTLGFICDEFAKFWKVGRFYLSFWNVFNSTLYALLTVSFITRMVALGHAHGNPERERMNRLSYNFLAFTAPMFWARLMLYFDSFRFFGAMLVVTKMMLKESLIFFALLFFVLIGFFQAFIGLDLADQSLNDTNFIVENMIKAVLTSPEFDGFEQFGPPFGIILYYIYAFVIMTILLNILIALFNSAYEDISSNSIDEYMALFAQKTLQFARAPDENVYIAPFNLIEIFCLIIPFEWWLPSDRYEKLNDYVMGVIYSPVLIITAYLEQRDARTVRMNRSKGESDEDTVEEWEQLDYKPEQEDEAWARKVRETSPNVEVDGVTVLVKDLKREVLELRKMVAAQSNPTGDFNEKADSHRGSADDRDNSGFGLHDS